MRGSKLPLSLSPTCSSSSSAFIKERQSGECPSFTSLRASFLPRPRQNSANMQQGFTPPLLLTKHKRQRTHMHTVESRSHYTHSFLFLDRPVPTTLTIFERATTKKRKRSRRRRRRRVSVSVYFNAEDRKKEKK